jgi:hypothetical protein
MSTVVEAGPRLARLDRALADLDPGGNAVSWLRSLVGQQLDRLPLPGHGATLQRWSALAAVAGRDLSLAKLYEGHTDALAIMAELEQPPHDATGATWGTWAAEAPPQRVLIEEVQGREAVLRGPKNWCSAAAGVSHGLLTAWYPDGRGPQLVRVAMRQPGVSTNSHPWHAVGMADSQSIDVAFDGAHAALIGGVGDYLSRPGFWQGGAGVAACWYGGARAIGETLRQSVMQGRERQRHPFKLAALGRVDLALHTTAAMLRSAAEWIDQHPADDARAVATRVRLAAEQCAKQVLDEAGRALGPAAFCRDARFARLAADLPVFIRQSHGDHDFAALGEQAAADGGSPWTL